MAFCVKNLMIQVLPDANALLPPTIERCRCNVLTVAFSNFTEMPPSLFRDPVALSELKSQLQSALSALEEQEKTLNEQTNFQTVAEAQALEDELTAALKEVQVQKEQLQNKDAKAQE